MSRIGELEDRLHAAAKKAVLRAATVVLRAVRQKLSQSRTKRNGPAGSLPGSPPAVLTGALRNSYTIDTSKINEANPAVRVGSNLIYARIHEFGGVIRPKVAQYLTVPISDLGRELRRTNRSLKDIPGAFVRKSRSGNVVVFQKRRREAPIPLVVLKRSVRLPPRPHLRPAFHESAAEIRDIVDKTIRNAISSELR